VIKPVYILARGYLNAPAIYSLGMLACLISMLYFRNKNKFKVSQQQAYMNNLEMMESTGMKTIHLSAFLITIFSYIVFWNTFPDLIAVFNPFKKQLGVKNVDYLKSFGMFVMSYIIIFVLVKTSLFFTG
jgi:hypothetical protein